MTLENELQKLKKYIGRPGSGFDKQLEVIKKNFSSAADKKKINAFIEEVLQESIADLEDFNKQMSVKAQLADVSEIISLSYISKKYFNKTRQWVYQRVNGSLVNGKPAKFTNEEIKTLNKAFKDIGRKIGATSIPV
ncbi:MAG: DUF5053 domain-containing protein [Niabella sp.]|nr:DUF5053 domain-containing protein [Niabella sp.]